MIAALLLALPQDDPTATLTHVATIPKYAAPLARSTWDETREAYVDHSPFVWSEDGTQVAWVGQRGEFYRPYVNAESVVQDAPYAANPGFLGNRAVFTLQTPLEEGRVRAELYVGGDRLGPHDWIGPWAPNAAGDAVAFWIQPDARVGNAVQATSKDQHLVIAIDAGNGRWTERKSDDFSHDSLEAPCFLSDGRTAVSLIESGSRWEVVRFKSGRAKVLGSEGTPQAQLAVGGSVVAWVDGLPGAEGSGLVKNGKPVKLKRIEGVERPRLDASGKHLAFGAVEDGRTRVHVVGEKAAGPAHDHLLELRFSPDGDWLAALVNDGGAWSEEESSVSLDGGLWSIVVHAADKPSEHVTLELEGAARDLSWSAEGLRLCWADGSRGAAYAHAAELVDDGETALRTLLRSGPYDVVGRPRLASDGGELRFGVRVDDELSWAVAPLP